MARSGLLNDGTAEPLADILDDMEPELRHLDGLIIAFQILGEAGDSIEPVVISSLARCARDTLQELEQDWRAAIGALRERRS